MREPVTTADEALALDEGERFEGYCDARAGEPEPGDNRSKAYWHGWRNGAVDAGRIPIDDAMRALAKDLLADPRFQFSVGRVH